MMKKFLQFIFRKPIAWLAEKLSSSPREPLVFSTLSQLLEDVQKKKSSRGVMRAFDFRKDRYIIFSDEHKGTRDDADDFRDAENDYLAALQYYYEQGFHFINLGDCEELWKYQPDQVIKKNQLCLEAEKKFYLDSRYYRIFGNHDIEWKYMLQRNLYLRPAFGKNLKVYEGLLLKTTYKGETFSFFFAHGHQGDQRNNGNRFSIWVVANIWTPIQRYFRVSINTPATSFELTDRHNIMMHEWSATQRNLIFISGHTHKPVFASMDHVERLTKKLDAARLKQDGPRVQQIEKELEKRKIEYAGKKQVQTLVAPTYFNSGCCCYDDGDITGIEIADGHIRLIKWHTVDRGSVRVVLEEANLEDVFGDISSTPFPLKGDSKAPN
jgi:predicted phosphodiesterase